MLRIIFDGYHPPARLSAGLNAQSFTLNSLLGKKVLRAAQWDKLFPPDGAAPDSQTFDITLLFLLLTNICELSPPPSGWHSKPSPDDNSLEANLARVKFFRNEVYGHVTSTSIDKPTFSSLWEEISVALVALGLDQKEIDKLKEEKCGAEDYLDVLMKWFQSEKEIKSHLTKLRRSQSTTQRSIGEVRQTQLEDHKMLQDSKSVLGKVHKTQTKIQSTIQGAAKSQDERLESLQKDVQEMKEAVVELSKGRNSGSQGDEVLRNLVKSEFKEDIELYVQLFQKGTREWVFSKVKNWLDDRNSQNRVMVICGNAGMGKSVISAVVCQRMQKDCRLCGSHFIQHNNVRYRKPQLMLQSLACHMCHALPEFKLALVEQLTRNTGKDLNDMGVEELFALLFKEPLSSVEDPGRNMLIVIDGLDESDYHDRNELLEVIANHFCKLPMWIRFLVTSRPERNIAKTLRHLQPFQLEAEDEQNQNDIKRFIGKKLECIPEVENTNDIVEYLVEKSEGLMLYAYFLLLYIEENPSVLKQGDEKGNLPLGISAVYHRYFKRLESELMTELGIKEDSFLNFLSALAASIEPLPIDFASRLLLSSTTAIVSKRKLLKAINSVSSLLPVRGDRLHIFHKSIKDWLTDECCYGVHDFTVDEKEGHRILTELCAAEFEFEILVQRRFAKSLRVAQFNDKTMYALQHGVRHMLEVDEDTRRDGIEDVVRKYVINEELVYAKLCVNSTVATEDIVCVLKEESFNSLSGETKASLETLLSILRKKSRSLMELPHVILQTMVNESRSVPSSEAKTLLNKKYDEIFYMELVNKNQQQSVVEDQFQCSSEVLCLDISPDQDYMVCECCEEQIQLWSLKTGKMEWRNPVLVKENDFKLPFREGLLGAEGTFSGTYSFYRSVAFHPDGKHILPGNLSTVYTIDGKKKELFSTSNCRFSVCTLLGDNTAMLTDCPNSSKCLVFWSLDTGIEMSRITRNEDIIYFQCSPDKNLLAVSHSTGSLCLFDLQNELTELGSISTNSPWGLMTFSVESDALAGLCLQRVGGRRFRCRITTNRFSQRMLSDFSEKLLLDCEETDRSFIDGDATGSLTSALRNVIPFGKAGSLMRLNSERALLSSPNLQHVSLINLAKIQRADIKLDTLIENVDFSTNGENVYVVSPSPPTVTVWEFPSWNLKAEKNYENFPSILPVKDGVIVLDETVELWDVELTECKRPWGNLQGNQLLPISEEQVACLTEDGTAAVLSTSDGRSQIIGNVRGWRVLAMNKKFEMIACKRTGELLVEYAVHLSDASFSSPRRIWSSPKGKVGKLPGGLFSPKGDFVVLQTSKVVKIYNATSGKLHRKLLEKNYVVDVKFITNQALIVCTREDVGNFLRMYDVISGEHLTTLDIEEEPFCLGVCLNSLLVAVGHRGSDVRLIQVHLPRSKRLSHE